MGYIVLMSTGSRSSVKSVVAQISQNQPCAISLNCMRGFERFMAGEKVHFIGINLNYEYLNCLKQK